MNLFGSSMFLLLLAAIPMAEDQGHAASSPHAKAEQLAEQPAGRTLWATGRGVGFQRQEEAIQEAEEMTQQQLLQEIDQLAAALTGRRLSPRQREEELARLLAQAGVDRKDERTTEEKPYGSVAEHTIRVTLSETVVSRWMARLAEQRRYGVLRILYGAAGTLLGWLAGVVVLVKLDRATGGYHRWVLVPTLLVVLLVATGLGWIGLIF